MITKEIIEQMDSVLKARVNVKDLEMFIRNNIDPKCKGICSRCQTQIRYAQRRVRKWAELNKEEISKIRNGK